MKHRIFTILSAVSLLLFLATVVLWVRSYWVYEEVKCFIPDPMGKGFFLLVAVSNYGSIDLGVGDYRGVYPHSKQRAELHYQSDASILSKPGIDMANGYAWDMRLPHWLPMLAMTILSAAWLIRKQRKRQHLQHGLCIQCGYDLTGNTSGICPECGTAVPAGSQAGKSGT